MTENIHEFRILDQIEKNPDATQADLAAQLGVAIGTVNWYVKRLIAKGFVKVTHLQRRRLRYLITPTGISEKAKLAYQYVQVSMNLYRTTREHVRRLLEQARQAGYDIMRVDGDGDLADVCRLTCLEHGIAVESSGAEGSLPCIEISGTSISLRLPEIEGEAGKNG